ncbi:SH3 and multiple ankyrin repeat domains protein 1-like, partial [Nilaparvata lugens]|uniref:SH3 and multiple ankyrin repeat domains protein 1-like n=1 Tax=Nilaparvata lugens TaxID=108931 RepID=UPI00193E712F
VVRPMYLRFQQDSNHSNTLTPDGFSHIAPSYLQSPAYASRKLLATSAPDLMNQTWPPPQQQRAENSPVRMRKAETALDGGGYYVTASPPYRVTASPPHVSINPNSLPPLVAASQDWPPPRSTAPGGYHWSLSSSSDNQQMIHHHSHHHHNHHQM